MCVSFLKTLWLGWSDGSELSENFVACGCHRKRQYTVWLKEYWTERVATRVIPLAKVYRLSFLANPFIALGLSFPTYEMRHLAQMISEIH